MIEDNIDLFSSFIIQNSVTSAVNSNLVGTFILNLIFDLNHDNVFQLRLGSLGLCCSKPFKICLWSSGSIQLLQPQKGLNLCVPSFSVPFSLHTGQFFTKLTLNPPTPPKRSQSCWILTLHILSFNLFP